MRYRSPKEGWVADLPAGPADRHALARLVEEDHDPAETEYYEAVADPEHVWVETARRRYRAAFRQRMRRRRDHT